jgi:hypothetical protein
MEQESTRRLVRRPLANDIILELWDYSRPVAGDRWLVALETRITIPVRRDTLPPDLQNQADQVLETLGDPVIFTHREERNFIAAREVPALLQEMQDRMLALAPGYFGHSEFAARFLRKTYAARQEEQRLRDLAEASGSIP